MDWLAVIWFSAAAVCGVSMLLHARGWTPRRIRNRWVRGAAWAISPVVWIVSVIGAPLFVVTALFWYPPVWLFRQARKWRVVSRQDATVAYLGEGRRSLMAQAAPNLDHDEIVCEAVDEWLDARGLAWRPWRAGPF